MQRTTRNEAFFVCEREVHGVERGRNTATPPWVLFTSQNEDGKLRGVIMPPQGPKCSTVPFIVRLVRSVLASTVECVVCLESHEQMACQLPCVHAICTPCLRKLFQLNRLGLTCPTCREHYPQHKIIETKGMGPAWPEDGVAIVMEDRANFNQ